MTDNKTFRWDMAAVVALLAIVIAVSGSGIAWLLKVERELAVKVSSKDLSSAKKELRKYCDGKFKECGDDLTTMKTELNTDIRVINERLNEP